MINTPGRSAHGTSLGLTKPPVSTPTKASTTFLSLRLGPRTNPVQATQRFDLDAQPRPTLPEATLDT